MWNYIWPILLIVLSNATYHIIAKSTPSNASPFLSLTVTYILGAIITFALYRFSPVADKGILVNMKNLNWTSFALGVAIIGLEVGTIYMYRQGWNISIGSLVANILLAVVLIIVGMLFYKEQLALKQLAGVVLCITGLILISF